MARRLLNSLLFSFSFSSKIGKIGKVGLPGERGPQGLIGLNGPKGHKGDLGNWFSKKSLFPLEILRITLHFFYFYTHTGMRGEPGMIGPVGRQGGIGPPVSFIFFSKLWLKVCFSTVHLSIKISQFQGPLGPQGIQGEIGLPGTFFFSKTPKQNESLFMDVI